MMGNRELFWSKCRGIMLNLELIWATPRYFTFLRWHQWSSRLVRHFWGTLCTSVKQIKTPYLFDWEQGIALQAVQGNQASSFSEREIRWFFLTWSGKLGYVLKLRWGKSFKTFVYSATSGLLSSYDGHLRNLNWLGRTIWTLMEVREKTKAHFLVGTVILDSYPFSKRVRHRHLLKPWIPCGSRRIKWCDSPLPDEAEKYGFL